MKCLGLMSGTSMDGVDCAVVDIARNRSRLRVKLLTHQTVPFSYSIRKRILLAQTQGTTAEICRLHVILGEVFARVALRTIKKAGLAPQTIKLIGSHGQTISHLPTPIWEAGIGSLRSSLQIGDPSVIAERTGITTVADFRARDLAVGGEGAPLVPYVHHLLFQSRHRSRLIVNLGGIANITFLSSSGTLNTIQAFDIGPCNLLLDGLVAIATKGKEKIDKNGRYAKHGQISAFFLNAVLEHPFLSKKPPKSTGREDFGDHYVSQLFQLAKDHRISIKDMLATSCEGIAASIAQAFCWLNGPVEEVFIGGGGVKNQKLLQALQNVLAPRPVMLIDKIGVSSKAFEALAFAVFAYQTVRGITTNIPSVTGARRPVVLGTIVPGKKALPIRL